MAAVSTTIVFKNQLVLPEQRQLFDYWHECANGREMPQRKDIHPSQFPRLLPHISLIDIEPDPLRFRVRLAGTRLREIYDQEITGLAVEEFDAGGPEGYWQRTYQRIMESKRPAQGAIRGPRLTKEHLVQFWLRLPLAAEAGGIAMILCHDACVPAVELPGTSDFEAFPVAS